MKDERARYEHHQNIVEDPGYLSYLSKIEQDCEPHLKKGDFGLDFGCGPSPLLGNIFSERGFATNSYDLFFNPYLEYQKSNYDFIILSEVIEHLRNPYDIMLELKGLLKSKGIIFIKTKLYPEKDLFHDWFYKRDLTHIQFFSEASLHSLAQNLDMKFIGKVGSDLYLLRNNLL